MELFSHEIIGAYVVVKVATSINKKGIFRYREAAGMGGNPEGVRGSEVHYKKLNSFAADMSECSGTEWELKELVYIDSPRQYYGLLSNGEHDMVYQYITTYAPGSGQQYFFSPLVGTKRIIGTAFDSKLAGWIIQNKYNIGLEKIHWQDRKNMLDLIKHGVTADVMETTLVMMR